MRSGPYGLSFPEWKGVRIPAEYPAGTVNQDGAVQLGVDTHCYVALPLLARSFVLSHSRSIAAGHATLGGSSQTRRPPP